MCVYVVFFLHFSTLIFSSSKFFLLSQHFYYSNDSLSYLLSLCVSSSSHFSYFIHTVFGISSVCKIVNVWWATHYRNAVIVHSISLELDLLLHSFCFHSLAWAKSFSLLFPLIARLVYDYFLFHFILWFRVAVEGNTKWNMWELCMCSHKIE